MPFSVGDVVRVRQNGVLRGGADARVLQVLPRRPDRGRIREYVVEFQEHPKGVHRSDRFLFCIYREDELVR